MKKILTLITVVILSLVSCMNNDKTVVLSDDTSKDTSTKYDVSIEEVKLDFKSGEYFVPGFIYDSKIYGYKGTRSGAGVYTGIYGTLDLKSKDASLTDRLIDEVAVSIDKTPFSKVGISRNKIDEKTWGNTIVLDNITNESFEIGEREKAIVEKCILENNFGPFTKKTPFSGLVSGESNLYYSSYIGGNEETNLNSLCFIVIDISNNKEYSMIIDRNTINFNDIEEVVFSSTGKQLFGLNSKGEVYEINLNEGKIKLVYTIAIQTGDRIEFKDELSSNKIISSNRILFKKFNDSTIELGVLNLDTLQLEELGFELDTKNVSVFKATNSYVLLQVENKESTEVVILNLAEKNNEVIYKFNLKLGEGIEHIASDDEGKYIALTISHYDGYNQVSKLNMITIDKF